MQRLRKGGKEMLRDFLHLLRTSSISVSRLATPKPSATPPQKKQVSVPASRLLRIKTLFPRAGKSRNLVGHLTSEPIPRQRRSAKNARSEPILLMAAPPVG
jgi:hypothetical protein